jgi:DnaJ-class molecular chaperone
MADDTAPPAPCSACRGTGKVISRLGENPQEVVCPWCEGGGRRLGPDHDAQAVRRGAGSDGGGEPPDAAA